MDSYSLYTPVIKMRIAFNMAEHGLSMSDSISQEDKNYSGLLSEWYSLKKQERRSFRKEIYKEVAGFVFIAAEG